MSEPKYINADDAIRHIEELTVPEERSAALYSANWIIDFLEAFPDAPVGRRSKWVAVNNQAYSPFDPESEPVLYICKLCLTKQRHRSNFCPNCGAEMREAENSETS